MKQAIDIVKLNEQIKEESSFIDLIRMEMSKVIIGQKHLIDNLLIALLATGIFARRSTGTGKNLSIKTLAKSLL